MATSVQSPSPVTSNKGSTCILGSSPLFSPSSDSRLWSALRNRVDSLLENQKPTDQALPTQYNAGGMERAKRLKEDSLLLLRGFDSVSHTLSELSGNIETALQGARELARPPTLSQIVHSTMESAKNKEKQSNEEKVKEGDDHEIEEGNRGLKRKIEHKECSEDEGRDEGKVNSQSPKELGNLKKAKTIAISMAKKAASIARELKSVKSDLSFLQERCTLLEAENTRLRDGFAKGIRPEEDDLMRLQMEALLAEKSRLANENANLTRENQCLNQLVEYHQLTSQDLTESYEHVISGTRLDFSSVPLTTLEEDDDRGEEDIDEDSNVVLRRTPLIDRHGFLASDDDDEE